MSGKNEVEVICIWDREYNLFRAYDFGDFGVEVKPGVEGVEFIPYVSEERYREFKDWIEGLETGWAFFRSFVTAEIILEMKRVAEKQEKSQISKDEEELGDLFVKYQDNLHACGRPFLLI
jgi:hypothetical protein